MIGVLAAAALAAAPAPPASEADAAAVIAYYEDSARATWVGPCGAVVPDDAGRFRTAYDEWRAAHEALIARGRDALRRTLEHSGATDDGDAQPEDFTPILREMPASDARAFCERQFGLRGDDDAES